MAPWGLVVKWAPAVPEDLWVLEVLILLGQTKWDLEHQWQDQEDQEGQEDLEDQVDQWDQVGQWEGREGLVLEDKDLAKE